MGGIVTILVAMFLMIALFALEKPSAVLERARKNDCLLSTSAHTFTKKT
jgi:hypothetical protein